MQTLRKKTSPLKYKNETSRFLGEGVSFKAKLIGILEVSEARGDRMCQEALSDLKTAIRAAGEHKQRITINIAIDGLRLRDEKTGDSLYHHPVHKISFIAQDMTDSRAFGYIFGSPDTGHRFFGIKTDKAASQVVIAMRDLFQVVFALKKKEIELAKQHLDKNRYGTSPPLFSESSLSTSKLTNSMQESSKNANAENKSSATNNDKPTPAVADLVDLELELNSLQQGLNQMERITPSDPFGSKDDPFGDSFTPFPKPILPPPPSSGKERSSRSSESSSLFSPKTPLTVTTVDIPAADASLLPPSKDMNFSRELNTSHDESSNGDWFASSANNNFVEDGVQSAEALKDEHEIKKQEILSQFDVFTELDPLGTGKVKPYIDKKHFFQELKNPPKKVLNDLVSENQPQESTAVVFFPTNFETKPNNISPHLFPSDPFGEDPFVKTDPFAEADFPKQDPFETEFEAFNREGKGDQPEGAFKNELQSLFVGSKSPKSSFLERQMTVVGTSPRSVFAKQNTFDAQFGKMSQLHENPSLDLSSESECAPEPPPRPTSNLTQVKPPPLPPKKQLGEICIKAPPRPPHSDDIHYDYVETYETAPNSLEYIKNLEKSPPLPVPIRKTKFESDFTLPERPKKQYNLSEDEDYLTPIALSKTVTKIPSPILLPPPQKSIKKSASPNLAQVTIASYLESKPNITTSISREKNTLDGLDITLSQLTISGLNELASKLNIPTTQLSNMTLVQLTNYLSNFIKNKNETEIKSVEKFADFANFNSLQSSETYDRYAVFRELLQEEIKQTKIDTEPQEILEENPKIQQEVDKYAALREIVEIEAQENGTHSLEENDVNEDESNLNEENEIQIENETNILNSEKFVENENVDVIEYGSVDVTTPTKSPVKSPPNKVAKSPVPVAITEIMQNNTRLPSGSLSDVVSGSSPEVDNNGSTPEVAKTNVDAAGESWAIFDQPNLSQDTPKEKQNAQSEEGVSPWSSDSKEFGNGSPPDYHPKIDSESGGEHWGRRRNHEGWWDTSAEPEVQYYPANRRSTDSYEDECYDCYERPRRRRQPGWQAHSAQTTGGHSSSSRDVSPWEEEPNRKREVREVARDQREGRDSRQMWSSRHGQHYFGRNMDRTHTDSWDEEDDYEYEEEHSNRFHWQDRHTVRDSDRDRRGGGVRDHESDRWMEDWSEERKQLRRRREIDRERWCCPDWNAGETAPGRYTGIRRYDAPPPNKWRDWKHDERCYSRDSQESPWEDDYSNDPDEPRPPHYLTIKRNWKRPSSASEMDRKALEIKPRHGQYHLGTGGSDGERDRRYKTTRRSKSRESQFSDTSHNRHKPDPGLTLRSRSKHHHQKAHFESEFQDAKKIDASKPSDQCNKKNSNLTSRKKSKDQNVKNEDGPAFPRKGTNRAQSLFENDFVSTENDSPLSSGLNQRFYFENDFETSETESPTLVSKGAEKNYDKPKLSLHRFDAPEFGKESRKRYPTKQRSLFEDDFSPTEKLEVQENVGISSIKEEASLNEEEEECGTTNVRSSGRKRILSKNRYSYNSNLKKSESVNIFARANDPFDDDFFSAKDTGGETTPTGGNEKTSTRTTELKWTEQFEHFDNNEGK